MNEITYSIILIRRISRKSIRNFSDSVLAVIQNSAKAITHDRIMPNRNIKKRPVTLERLNSLKRLSFAD